MSTSCLICNKGTQMVGGYSNRVRATQYNPTGKRRKKPNLVKVRTADGKRMIICTSCQKKGKHLSLKKVR